MSELCPLPWLTIIGIGEDGLNGLSPASRTAIKDAEFVFGGARHLKLAECEDKGRAWSVPFSITPVVACRDRKTVMLVSGDPFWYGAGATIGDFLTPAEWVTHPSPSIFSMIAARLGWRIEETSCIGLHAAPFERLVPELANGQSFICTLRDGNAPGKLAHWLTEQGFGDSQLEIFECLGGPNERHQSCRAGKFDLDAIAAPVAVAFEAYSQIETGLSHAPGRLETCFANDGQITKAPVRAMTIAALQPRPFDLLWDLGAGSGSVSVEYLLAAPKTRAVCVETRVDRTQNIAENAQRFGLGHRMTPVHADLMDHIDTLRLSNTQAPDVIFIGGGANDAVLTAIFERCAAGTRLVVNSVTLETESLLTQWHAAKGGHLVKLELSEAAPLGRMRGWDRARPVVQWSVTL